MQLRSDETRASESPDLRLSLHRLNPAAEYVASEDDMERLVVVMGGQCHMAVDDRRWQAVGRRRTVFFGAPYVAYVPRGSQLRIWNESGTPCEFAVVSARAGRRREPWLATADQIVAGFDAAFTGRESAVGHGIVLAQAGVHTDRLDIGERLISPGSGVFIPFEVPRRMRGSDGLRTSGHIVHYRLFPTAGRAYQWAVSDDAEPVETRTVYDGDSHVLPSGKCAAIAPPGTYVYYLWAAAVEVRDQVGDRRVVHTRGS